MTSYNFDKLFGVYLGNNSQNRLLPADHIQLSWIEQHIVILSPRFVLVPSKKDNDPPILQLRSHGRLIDLLDQEDYTTLARVGYRISCDEIQITKSHDRIQESIIGLYNSTIISNLDLCPDINYEDRLRLTRLVYNSAKALSKKCLEVFIEQNQAPSRYILENLNRYCQIMEEIYDHEIYISLTESMRFVLIDS